MLIPALHGNGETWGRQGRALGRVRERRMVIGVAACKEAERTRGAQGEKGDRMKSFRHLLYPLCRCNQLWGDTSIRLRVCSSWMSRTRGLRWCERSWVWMLRQVGIGGGQQGKGELAVVVVQWQQQRLQLQADAVVAGREGREGDESL